MNWLKGKKTFIAAILLAIGAWGAYLNEDATMADAIQRTVEAVALIALRLGVAKAEVAAKEKPK